MKDGFIKAAAASPEIRVADCDYNADAIINSVMQLAQEQVKLAVFPELCITGYTCGDLFLQKLSLMPPKEQSGSLPAKPAAVILYLPSEPRFRYKTACTTAP